MPLQDDLMRIHDHRRWQDSLVGGGTAAEIARRWPGSPTRLDEVLDDLVASGDVAVLGSGRGCRYRGRG